MITVKDVIYEDFVNYKLPSMFVIFPKCSFKCEKESGVRCCQNSALAQQSDIRIDVREIVNNYISNPITKAVVCGGLEPLDSFNDLLFLINEIRKHTKDDIVIYTGYNKKEIAGKIDALRGFGNIIVKFGRFIPGTDCRWDETLGVMLASKNQYAEKIC